MMLNPLMQQSAVYDATKNSISVDELKRRAYTAGGQELRQAAQEFESLFVKIMLDSMRATLNDEGLIPKNSAEKLFEDELYSEYAKSISRTANLGIADMIYNQFNAAIPGSRLDIRE